MFCGTCGKELRDGAKFCDECGAVVAQSITAEVTSPSVTKPIQPVLVVPPKPEKPKKVKKERKPIKPGILAAVAIVLILAVVAAVAIPILFPATETVYVLTSCTYTSVSGKVSHYELEYDESGNLIRGENWQASENDFSLPPMIHTYEYDDHNNLTALLLNDSPAEEYDYRYDEDGRITEYTVTTWSGNRYTCELTYDKKGNLILAEYDYDVAEDVTQPLWCRWQSYEYDKQNRLTAEVFCDEYDYAGEHYYQMVRCEYDYDDQGNVTDYRVLTCETEDPEDDPDYEEVEVTTFSYDDEGRRTEMEYEIKGASRTMEYEYDYDRDGNLKPDDDDEYTFDENGNLICIEYENGAKAEFTYEAFTVSREEAEILNRRKRWYPYLRSATGNTFGLDPLRSEMRLPIGNLPASIRNHLYYYLIPNPIW